MMDGDRVWCGTAGKLAKAITPKEREQRDRLPKDWPDNGQKLAGQLKRVAPVLRSAGGVDVEYDETARPRVWTR